MQRMMQGGGKPPGAGAPAPSGGMAAPTGGTGGQAPAGSPTAQPQDKKGLKAAAMSNLHIAQNMLEQALTAFAPEDKEYKVILKCLNSMAPLAADRDSSDLVPAEIMRMVGQMPQMGGGTDIQRMIQQKMAQGGQPPQGGGQPQQPQPPQGM
jgi:hypothetical protein